MFACTLALLTGFVGFDDKPNEAPAFDSIRVHQTGGFVGVDIVYEIGRDGKWHRIAKTVPNKGKTDGRLDAKPLGELRETIGSINWEKLPGKLINPNVADDFRYEIRVVVGKTKHTVVTDGTSASKQPALRKLLATLTAIERAGADR